MNWYKQWVRSIGNFKFLAGLYFMGTVIMYMIFGYLLGENQISFSLLWQILLAAVIGAGMQKLFFESPLCDRLSIKLRASIHFIGSYCILLGLSQIFNWFDLGLSGLLVKITLAYVLFYIAIFWGFYIYAKAEGNRYNQKLEEYKIKNR